MILKKLRNTLNSLSNKKLISDNQLNSAKAQFNRLNTDILAYRDNINRVTEAINRLKAIQRAWFWFRKQLQEIWNYLKNKG